jgi:hypothetical protein
MGIILTYRQLYDLIEYPSRNVKFSDCFEYPLAHCNQQLPLHSTAEQE